MRKYLIISTIVTSACLAFYSLNDYLFGGALHKSLPLVIVFFFVQSVPISWMLHKSSTNPEKFSGLALASLGIRMITSLFLLLAIYGMGVEDFTNLAIQFVILYFVYLIFEITVVLSNLRRN